MHRHCLDIVAHPLTSWLPSIIVIRPLGWSGGSLLVVAVHLLGWSGGLLSIVVVVWVCSGGWGWSKGAVLLM